MTVAEDAEFNIAQYSKSINNYFSQNIGSLPKFDLSCEEEQLTQINAKSLTVGLVKAPPENEVFALAFTVVLRIILSDLKSIGLSHHINIPTLNQGIIDADLSGRKDKSKDFTDLNHQSYIAKIYESKHIVNGSISSNKNLHILELNWLHARTLKQLNSTKIESDDFSNLILNSLIWILGQNQIELNDLDRGKLSAQLIETELLEIIKIFKSHIDVKDGEEVPTADLQKFIEARTVPLAYLSLYTHDLKFQLNSSEKILSNIKNKFNNHSQLLMTLSYKSISYNQNKAIKKLISQVFVDKLSENSLDRQHLLQSIYQFSDLKQYEHAISLGLFAIETFPNQYHFLWSISVALVQRAWQIRGNGWWDAVEESKQHQFMSLTQIATELSDMALKMQPRCAVLLNDKINFENGFSDEMWEYFIYSIESEPTYQESYSSAMNFSQPRWGGYFEAQMFIIRKAYKNISDINFHRKLFVKYILLNQDYGMLTRFKYSMKYVFNNKKLFEAE